MTTFVCADMHLGHRGITQLLRQDGTKERPWGNVEEMNEALIANWNSVVRPKDTVIVLGDFVINRSALPLADRLNGTKELVMGNHDTMRAEEYLVYFKKLHGVACVNTNRNFIGIEMNSGYFKIAEDRIKKAKEKV